MSKDAARPCSSDSILSGEWASSAESAPSAALPGQKGALGALFSSLGKASDRELARRYRMSKSTVARLRKRYGVTAKRTRSLARAQAGALFLMDSGLTAEQIAEHAWVRRDVNTVRKWFREWGFAPQKTRHRKTPVHIVRS